MTGPLHLRQSSTVELTTEEWENVRTARKVLEGALEEVKAERDRLCAQVDGLIRHRDGCVANLEAIRSHCERAMVNGDRGQRVEARHVLRILDGNRTP